MPIDGWLVPLGFAIGVLGTLIGAGGGFILVPILLVAYPGIPPDWVTAISLSVVACNAISGSWAYARRGRIDYRSGVPFALATIPGAILGAISTSFIPRSVFDTAFGILMVAGSGYLIWHPQESPAEPPPVKAGHAEREIVDESGEVFRYSFSMRTGILISVGVGFLSSLLGIGGGVVHVPVLVHMLGFPVHVATATSHFVLAITTVVGVLTHLANGTMGHVWISVALLAPGVVVGAQIGAWLSERVKGPQIVRALAVALAFAGIRILLEGLKGG